MGTSSSVPKARFAAPVAIYNEFVLVMADREFQTDGPAAVLLPPHRRRLAVPFVEASGKGDRFRLGSITAERSFILVVATAKRLCHSSIPLSGSPRAVSRTARPAAPTHPLFKTVSRLFHYSLLQGEDGNDGGLQPAFWLPRSHN